MNHKSILLLLSLTLLVSACGAPDQATTAGAGQKATTPPPILTHDIAKLLRKRPGAGRAGRAGCI